MGQLWIVQEMAENIVKTIEKTVWISCRGISRIGSVYLTFRFSFSIWGVNPPEFPLNIHKLGLDPQTTHSKPLLHSCHHSWESCRTTPRANKEIHCDDPCPFLRQLCLGWLFTLSDKMNAGVWADKETDPWKNLSVFLSHIFSYFTLVKHESFCWHRLYLKNCSFVSLWFQMAAAWSH